MCSFNVSLFFFTSVPSTEKSAGGRRGAGLTSEPTFPPRVLMYYYNTVQEYFTVRCNKQTQVSVRPSTASSSCTLQLAASSRSALQHLFEFPSPAGLSGSARDATPKLITRERHRPSDEPDKHHVHIITCDHSGSNIDELASSSSILLSKCW